MKTETLSPDVGWEASGHLSEVALCVAADGEEALLDAEMHGHLGSCDTCAMRLGRVALRSEAVADAFADVAAVAKERESAFVIKVAPPASARPKRKAPAFAIAAALTVALISAAPAMKDAPVQWMHMWALARKLAPAFVRLFPQMLGRAWSGSIGALSALVWCIAVALVLTGFTIAKQASKKALVDGGRQ